LELTQVEVAAAHSVNAVAAFLGLVREMRARTWLVVGRRAGSTIAHS